MSIIFGITQVVRMILRGSRESRQRVLFCRSLALVKVEGREEMD
jgi:hypothetical protein